MRSGRKRVLGKALLGLLYVPLAAEVFLRVLAPVPVVPRYVTASPYGIRVNEPNRTYWHTSADFRIQIRTNSKGIRADREIPYDKPFGVKRIVVLGDSFGMGYEVNLADSFLAVTEQQLHKKRVLVEVVNLSVSGHGNAEELIMLREEGVRYHPDLVLLCWHSTDLDDNVRCGLFELRQGRLVRKNHSYLPGVVAQQQLYRIPGFEWIAAHSNLYAFVRERVSYFIVKKTLVMLESFKMQRDNDSDTVGAHGAAGSAEPAWRTDLTIALLKEIEKEARATGARFLILDIPGKQGRSEFVSVFPRARLPEPGGLTVVNPIEVFEAHKGEMLYWERSQRHFTPAGCRLVGEILADEIVKRRLLGP